MTAGLLLAAALCVLLVVGRKVRHQHHCARIAHHGQVGFVEICRCRRMRRVGDVQWRRTTT